mgnify:CR=1 FL=1
MPRFFIGWLLGLGGAAIGLIVSSFLFDGFSLHVDGFIWSLLIFAILSAILPFFILKALLRHAGSIVALSGLFATFISLLVTDLFTSGLSISGATAWIGSTLVIWILGMFIWILPGPWRTHRKVR